MSACPNLADALSRAVALRPVLAERALDTEKLRCLPGKTMVDLHQSELFRLLQPARVGGAELPLQALVEVSAELARSCASTAWVLANLASHHWMLGMWPQAAQQAVWGVQGERAHHLIGASLIFPAGRAVPCAMGDAEGYRLNGCWGFASGINDCQWVMLGAIVASEAQVEERGEYRLFLLPRGEYTVRDTWQVAGLCGTGSNEVTVRDVLIPSHRSLSLTATRGGLGVLTNTTNTLREPLPAPLYRVPLLPTFGYMIAGVVLGIAQGMLDLFVDSNCTRLTSYSSRMLSDYPTVHVRVAEAAASIDAARRILMGNCGDIMTTATMDAPPALLEKMRLRRDAAFATQLCRRAVDLLFDACGGAALYLSHPAQRSLRDMRAACAHITLNWDAAASLYGHVAVGHGADLPPYER